MFEDAEVDGFLVWLDAPGDGVVAFDIDPSHEVGLFSECLVMCILMWYPVFVIKTYLAVNLELFHSRHAKQNPCRQTG